MLKIQNKNREQKCNKPVVKIKRFLKLKKKKNLRAPKFLIRPSRAGHNSVLDAAP